MGRAVTAPAAATPRPAIVSPLVDGLCAGGLSLLILVPLLVTGRGDLLLVSGGVAAWLTALINMPHFLASYRMVYRTRDTIRAHPWAAIYVPAVILLCSVGAVIASRWTDFPISMLLTAQSAYLAWHYTGQAWGMTATYSYLDGASFNPVERKLIRGGLYILLVWHVTWFFHLAWDKQIDLTPLYEVVTLAMALALAMGLVGFCLYGFRTRRLPGVRTLIPWLAIFVWYAAMARWGLPALFAVQMAHALQYLIFPMRVEANRTRRGEYGGRVVRHMVAYLIVLLAASVVAAIYLPMGAMAVVTSWLGSRPGEVVGFAFLAFLNIHHYFTDGVMWKLRNPAVRQDLFGHLAQPEPVPAPVTAAPKSAARRRQRRNAQ